MSTEFTNKIAVVPYEMMNQLNQNQLQTNQNLFTKPEVLHLQNLDTGLKNILFETSLDPEIKYRKYVELFNQYQNLLADLKKPLEIKIKEQISRQPEPKTKEVKGERDISPFKQIKTQPSDLQQEPIQERNYQLENVIEKMPDKFKEKAMNFIETLENNPKINWSNDGQLHIDDKQIEGSSISETLLDFMRTRKNTDPGFEEIVWKLMDDNYAKRNIINKKRWSQAAGLRTKSVKRGYGEQGTMARTSKNSSFQFGSGLRELLGRSGANDLQQSLFEQTKSPTLRKWKQSSWK